MPAATGTMHRTREGRLRRKIARYPALNALSSDKNVTLPVTAPPDSDAPWLCSLRLKEESKFWAYLRSRRFEEVADSPGPANPNSVAVVIQDVLDVVNCGKMFVPGVRELTVTHNPARNPETDCFQLLYLVVLAAQAEPQRYVLPPGAAPLGDASRYDKYFCCIFLLKYGTFDKDAWVNQFPEAGMVLAIGSQSWILAPFIVEECELAGTQWAVVTDGVTTALIQAHHESEPESTGRQIILEVGVESDAFQLCVARLIMAEAEKCGIANRRSSYWQTPVYSGALNDPQLSHPTESEVSPEKLFSLPHFDVFLIQRDLQYWKHFLAVQTKAEVAALEAHLLPGARICSSSRSLTPETFLHLPVSPVPFPTIPKETRYRLWCDAEELRRPRDAVASTLIALEGNIAFSFHVSDTFRTGKASYSQTVCGFLEFPAEDGSVLRSGKLCLKLYDERLFKVPKYQLTKEDVWVWSAYYDKPHNKVTDWTTAEDMARRECAAYNRLKDYQGFVVPHCYGLFEFQLPDNHRCIGLLMEMVEGKHLHEFRSDELSELEKGELVIDVRHAVRVLRYAQIHQADWNSGNVIVSRVPNGVPGADGTSQEDVPDGVLDNEESGSGKNAMVRGQFSIVLIDFAFAFQHLLLSSTPLVNDLNTCRNMLYELDIFARDLVRETWFDIEGDENEW